MSSQELPRSFGFMLPAFSLPMKAERSRNKERLEASLAGLCELELLKQRQECRVLSALCLGDSPVPGRPPWGLRSARCSLDAPKGNASGDCSLGLHHSTLHCAPWDIDPPLEQQVAELKVKLNTELKSAETSEDSQLSSGEVLGAKQNKLPEFNYQFVMPRSLSAPEGTGDTEIGEISDQMGQATAAGALEEMRDVDLTQEDSQQAQKVETYIAELIQRRALPTRPSKPRTSLAHDARAVSVVRQSSLCRKEEQQSLKQVSVQEISFPFQSSEGTPKSYHTIDQDHSLGKGFFEDSLAPYKHHLQQSIHHQLGFYNRPSQASMINASDSTLLDYASFKVLQSHPDSSNSEPDSHQHFHYHSPQSFSKLQQPLSPDEQLVNGDYIPAQPCHASARGYAHPHSNHHKSSGVPKPNRNTHSPERSHHRPEPQPTSQIQPSKSRGGPKKCHSNDDRGGASKKQGKKACRSQSENSLQRISERKYNTVERDGGGSGNGGRGSRSSQSRDRKQQQQVSGSYRRWQSTLEVSQDEADQSPMQTPIQNSGSIQRDQCGKRTRKSRPTHASYAFQHHRCHHQQHMEYQSERVQVPWCQAGGDYPHPGQGESESSMSEADSPNSSSLSCDSDESGGLVWPQQLPPQLSLPSTPAPPGAPLQPKAFVKIKASHALKKKILRFRTGSLKVMTTV